MKKKSHPSSLRRALFATKQSKKRLEIPRLPHYAKNTWLAMAILLLFFPCYSLFSAQDFYSFDSLQQKQRFQLLTTQLRCLVCQNENIAESNAGLAGDLREQIYQKMQQGKTDKQIIDYLVTRYGDFILYQPPVNALTIGLWAGPFLLLCIGLAYLFYYIKKRN